MAAGQQDTILPSRNDTAKLSKISQRREATVNVLPSGVKQNDRCTPSLIPSPHITYMSAVCKKHRHIRFFLTINHYLCKK